MPPISHAYIRPYAASYYIWKYMSFIVHIQDIVLHFLFYIETTWQSFWKCKYIVMPLFLSTYHCWDFFTGKLICIISRFSCYRLNISLKFGGGSWDMIDLDSVFRLLNIRIMVIWVKTKWWGRLKILWKGF